MQKKLHLLLVMIFFTVSSVLAQITTSSMSGKITDKTDNAPVIGAIVQAVHVPSGTKYGAATNMSGRYTIQGMRAGGPYKVTVSYVGSKTKEFDIKSLSLGETYELSTSLAENTTLLQGVVVSAKQTTRGEATIFNNSQIELAPTIDRNIYDVIKQTTLVSVSKYGGVTVSGNNNRYNSFQIDGTVSNDVFGLAGSGTNGGQTGANPISLDAIEQIQVSVAPFDVRQSGFTGGAINAVTKSGTNQFHGSAYGYYNNQNFYGRHNQALQKTDKMTKQYDETFGATIGGPIIKDKLFFFASAEYKKNSYPNSWYPGVDDNSFVTAALAQQIADLYYQRTGIRESFGPKDVQTQSLGVLGRIDWNINDKHKLTFRYQYNGASQDKANSSATTLYFNNSGYKQTNRTHSFVAELHSKLSDIISNEARASYIRVRDWRDVPYQGPTAYITNARVFGEANPNGAKSGSINIGTEYSSGINSLDQDNITIEDNLSFYLGNHTLTIGTHNESYNFYNGYYQYSNGEYYYNGINDFLNNNATRYYYNYSDYALTGSYGWLANVQAGQLGLYAQDKWDASELFQLTYGLRFDAPFFWNSPTANPAFNTSVYARTYGVRVGQVPDFTILTSPRVGFRLYLNKSKKTLLRGGTGLFTGRVPFVWLSNVYSNTGMEMKSTTLYTVANQLDHWQDQMALVQSGASSAKPTINTVSGSFKYPQTWRSNLALEQDFGAGFKASVEALYSKNLNAVYFENLALKETSQRSYVVPGVEASSVPYYSTNAGAYYNIINLRSINQGYSYQFIAKIEKSFNFGLDLSASYTFGHSKAVNDGLSSVALSNWNNYASTDVNEAKLSYSMFDMPHQVKVRAMFNSPKYAGGLLNTEVGLTYYGNTGMRYSLTMSESTSGNNNKTFNGDGRSGHTLLYIPTDAEIELMNWKTPDDKVNFQAWCANDRYAKEHRGEFAERFGAMAPWENHFDFHFAENFFYNKRGGKVQLSLDITNVANLLNKKWGTYYSSTTAVSPLKVESIAINGDSREGTFSYTGTTGPSINNIFSRWHAQLGLKVTF